MGRIKRSVIVAGMPRAGSTWLYYNFVKHPQVAMPKYKETFFFGSNFSRGYEWYYSLYPEDVGDKVAFDVSPNYFCDEDFFTNIQSFDVDHRVVLVLREPAEWIVSLYSQLKSFTPNLPPMESYLEKCRIDFDGGYYEISLNDFDFAGVVEKFIERYPGRLLLVNFEEIKKDPVRVLNEVESFAGLDRYFDEETAYIKPVNVSIPKFNVVAYLSTKPLVRKVAVAVLPGFVKDRLIDYLYKVGRASEKDHEEIRHLEGRFQPLYQDKYFSTDDVRRF
jgi:hypothetical protein